LGTEQEWIDTALLRRPEIQASVWRIRALGDEAGLAQLAPWEGASAGVAAERSDGWQFGPVVETPLPLFDDGSARRARNVAEQLEARHELTSLKRRIVEEVRTAHAALAASTTNLARIERELIPIQQQRRVLAEDAYRAGQTDVTPLFLAEQDLRVARTQAIEVEKQGARAFVQLQRAVGGPGIARRVTTDAGARVAPAAEPTAQVLPPSPVR
ncbi:MAG: TolC family protein, partial [Planctomycetota bacterium]